MDSIQVSPCHPFSLHYAVKCRYVVTAPAFKRKANWGTLINMSAVWVVWLSDGK
jgi:hypothetical protein